MIELPACPICKQADQVRHGRYIAATHTPAFKDWTYYLVCDRCRVRVETKRDIDCGTIWTGGEA